MQTIRITILMLLIVVWCVKGSHAMETDVQVENVTTYSDNINRLPKGEELNGYLITLEGDVNLSTSIGSGTADLNVGGGRETLYDGETRDEDNYRFSLDVFLPWSGTGHVGGHFSTSEARAEPEVSDVNQVRVRTRIGQKRLEVGKRATVNLEWLLALNNTTELRFDRDLEETEGQLGWEAILSRRNSLFFDVGLRKGQEEVDDVTWTGNSASIEFRKQQDRLTAGGYKLDWQGQELEKADGTAQQTDKLGVLAYYSTRTASGWLFASNLGVDLLNPPSEDRRWEPRASVSLEGAPERTLRGKGSIATFITIQDPVESQIAWTRDSQILGGLVWRVSRKYTVEPTAQYRLAEVFGNNTSDRTDETFILRVGTSWTPSRNWTVDLNAQAEDRISSQAAFELAERKLELRVTAVIL